ncbi:Clp protease N-terminal domain-containing protein [Actinomadura scrupuli]|uniref:Clp protease N-terminal domain-containing protein n=1 Tax=Actinomadura scrupuli TaxID=559629 RepID=UPI003D976C62
MSKNGCDTTSPTGAIKFDTREVHMAPDSERVDLGPYTARARTAVKASQVKARAMDHGEVTTGHVLLSLTTGSGMASSILAELDVSPDTLQRAIEEQMGLGEQPAPEHIPFSQGTRQALTLASLESPGTESNRIGTDHLLIGLLREGGFAAQILAGFSVTADKVVTARGRVCQIMCYGCVEYGRQAEPLIGPELVLPAGVPALNEQLEQVRHRKEVAIHAQDYELAASIRGEEKDILRRRLMLLDSRTSEFDLAKRDRRDRAATRVRRPSTRNAAPRALRSPRPGRRRGPHRPALLIAHEAVLAGMSRP